MLTRLPKALVAGIGGTVLMTLFAWIAPYLHLPRLDMPALFSSYFQMPTAMGWLLFFVIGIALAAFYGAMRDNLPFHSWQKGLFYALILWGATEVVIMPVMGMGFFAGSLTAAAGALVAYLFYGAAVGYLYERK